MSHIRRIETEIQSDRETRQKLKSQKSAIKPEVAKLIEQMETKHTSTVHA